MSNEEISGEISGEVLGVLTGQVTVPDSTVSGNPPSGNPPSGTPDAIEAGTNNTDFPECDNHIEYQHRDGNRPWCRSCGWSRGRPAIPPVKIKEIRHD